MFKIAHARGLKTAWQFWTEQCWNTINKNIVIQCKTVYMLAFELKPHNGSILCQKWQKMETALKWYIKMNSPFRDTLCMWLIPPKASPSTAMQLGVSTVIARIGWPKRLSNAFGGTKKLPSWPPVTETVVMDLHGVTVVKVGNVSPILHEIVPEI